MQQMAALIASNSYISTPLKSIIFKIPNCLNIFMKLIFIMEHEERAHI